MNKQVVNNSFVFYASFLETVEKAEKISPELANELMKAIIEYGIYGEYESDNPYIDMLMPNITTVVDKAKDRYAKAVENGKKGGRPSTIDKDKVIYLHNQGLTNKEIAAEMNCSLSTVEKTVSKYKKDNNFLPKNRKNPEKPSKNLDVDEDLDGDVDGDYDVDVDGDYDYLGKCGKIDRTVITYEDFLRLGEEVEMRLINNNKEAIRYDTGEILTVIGAPLPFNKIAK